MRFVRSRLVLNFIEFTRHLFRCLGGISGGDLLDLSDAVDNAE